MSLMAMSSGHFAVSSVVPLPDSIPGIQIRERSPEKSSFGDRIIRYMESQKYKIYRGDGEINIVYVEGVNEDGSTNGNEGNKFNDRRIVIQFKGGKPEIIGNWDATVNPGVAYLGMNPNGLPHTLFGQYKSWQVGQHCGLSGGSCHEGLIQVAPIKVVRAWTAMRPSGEEVEQGKTFDGKPVKIQEGEFDINQHWGYDYSLDDIAKASAGCLVGRTIAGHQEFMGVVKRSAQYRQNPGFIFETAIVPGWDLK